MGGQKSGVPLVLLHGGPGIPGETFTDLMTRLATRRPVVRYDQIGCGRSDRPNDPSLWRLETFLDELALSANNSNSMRFTSSVIPGAACSRSSSCSHGRPVSAA